MDKTAIVETAILHVRPVIQLMLRSRMEAVERDSHASAPAAPSPRVTVPANKTAPAPANSSAKPSVAQTIARHALASVPRKRKKESAP